MKEQVKDGAGTWDRCPPDAGSNARGEDSGPTRSMNARRSAHSSAPESVSDWRGGSPLQAYALRPVTNCYCVAARRGGELQEVSDPSVG